MTRIKICGLGCRGDVEILNVLLPDYAGFVFCPSKRQIDPGKAKKLCVLLGSSIKKVGVFVNQKRGDIEKIKGECGLDVVQLHGDEAPGECAYDGCEVWKAIRVRDEKSLAAMEEYRVDRFLLDAYSENAYGGTGKAFNWDILGAYKGKNDIVLAGGLNPLNIEAAIRTVAPYAVDLSSGVEHNGKKDFDKVKDLIQKVRACDE
ncbi:MAG: phosphoribosylanthranilate isomerase [Eubacteriales bacterium]|nr:phosphoribosylanthranilate isomerase [Eubacteriales bacterium]